MKRLACAVAAVLTSLSFAAPALARGSGSAGSCGIGVAVSATTRSLGGIGRAAHQLGFRNVGNALLQPFVHAPVKATCH